MGIWRNKWTDLVSNDLSRQTYSGVSISACPSISCHHLDFSTQVGFLRNRLQQLVSALDAPRMRRGQNEQDALLTALRVTYGDFLQIKESPYAWQDVHAADASLIADAERLLSSQC